MKPKKLIPTAGSILFLYFLIASCAITAMPSSANAAVTSPQSTNYGLDEFQSVGVGQSDDLKTIIADIVNIALGFLGVLAVVIIIYAGFKWMTAAGNEEQAGDAKKMITQAVIGLVIIFLAWTISSFVIDKLTIATGA